MQNTPFKLAAKSLAITTLLATFASTAMAQSASATPPASFTWYGRIDLAFESNNDGLQGRTQIQNFASRVGFKGERSVSDDLSGIFQVETGVAPDDTSQSKTFASRNSFIGLRSKTMGALIMGTHDMPFKSLEGTANQLWGEGDAMEVIIHGKGSSTSIGSAVFSNVHTRKTNVMMYTSPKFSNIVAKLAYSPDEAQTAVLNRPMYSASVEYNDGSYNVGLAYQNQDKFTATGGAMEATKLTAGMKFGPVSIGAAFSTIDNNSGKKTDNVLLTGSYAMGPVVLKANFGQSSDSSSNADDGLSMAGLEVDYALDKQITLYSYYSTIDNKAKAKGTFAGADNFPATARVGDDPNAFGLGIRFNF
jgi:predicted porin